MVADSISACWRFHPHLPHGYLYSLAHNSAIFDLHYLTTALFCSAISLQCNYSLGNTCTIFQANTISYWNNSKQHSLTSWNKFFISVKKPFTSKLKCSTMFYSKAKNWNVAPQKSANFRQESERILLYCAAEIPATSTGLHTTKHFTFLTRKWNSDEITDGMKNADKIHHYSDQDKKTWSRPSFKSGKRCSYRYFLLNSACSSLSVNLSNKFVLKSKERPATWRPKNEGSSKILSKRYISQSC